ncbi:MAG: hypothetical protein ACKOXB_09180 [Flavobacteriales bacterium]
MTRRRRFTVFFISFGLMSIFLFVTLAGRQDNILDKLFGNMFPSSRAKTALLNEEVQEILFSSKAKCHLQCLNISEKQLIQALNENGDVDLMNDKTDVHKSPKVYYMETEVGTKTYFVVIHAIFGVEKMVDEMIKKVDKGQSFIDEVGIVGEKSSCACQ